MTYTQELRPPLPKIWKSSPDDIAGHIENIRNSLRVLELYATEKKKVLQKTDIIHNLKRLPYEVTTLIFMYIELTPFKKADFLQYHKRRAISYFIYYQPMYTDGRDYLIGYDTPKGPPSNIYSLQVRIRISCSCDFFISYQRGKFNTRQRRLTGFGDLQSASKSQSLEYIQRHITVYILKQIKKNLPLHGDYISKWTQADLRKVIIYHALKYN
jgi:hypothetical protein